MIDQKSGRMARLENIFTSVKISRVARVAIINEAPVSFLLRCSFPAARPRVFENFLIKEQIDD